MIDPKPAERIVDGTAEPLDSEPIEGNYCPLCRKTVFRWERAHIVGKGVGGDDVPENLVWLCADCHWDLHCVEQDSLTHRRLVIYCREKFPELGAYADRKKYFGYIERRYLGA